MSTNSDQTESYAVGYGRPPTQHRFQKGKSGNPKGRPKKCDTNLTQALQNLLADEVKIQQGDKQRSFRKDELMIRTLFDRAMKGNQKAFSDVVKFATLAGLFPVVEQPQYGGVIVMPHPLKSSKEQEAEYLRSIELASPPR